MAALTRRSFLAGLITAPAIVHAANIMKVRPVLSLADELNDLLYGDDALIGYRHYWCRLEGRIFYRQISSEDFYTS